jgi:L-threonylcarbamoyladenylate synthase
MHTLLITDPDNQAIARAGEILRAGGLVVFPTETVYGLGADATDASAASKIYAAKGRPSDNPLIVHLADPSDAERYAVTSELYYRLAERFMPGPLTVVLPKREIIPSAVTGGLDSVAIRVPSHPVAHTLIKAAGVPVAAPSANLSGRPSPTTARHAIEDMYGRADCIIAAGDCEFGVESTVVKPEGDGVTLLRPGAVTPEMLGEVCPVRLSKTLNKSVASDTVPESPGMKYRHYAPDVPMYILDGTDEAVYAYLADKTDCAVICFNGDTELLRRENAYSLGDRDDSESHAHRLFAVLNDINSEAHNGAIKAIYARMTPKDGVGLAVFNRLIKAAGYNVIKF